MADDKERAFQNLIAPLRELGQKFARANTKPDAVLDGSEIAAMAVQDSLANPNMNLSPAKLQAYSSQAVAFRAELDAASSVGQTNEPRTRLLQSIARNGVQSIEGRPIAETEALLRSDLQKFAKEAGQPIADGGAAMAHDIAQGMLALNGVQKIIEHTTRVTQAVLNENKEQLPFAQRDLKTEIADQDRIDARVIEQNASRVTPQQMLADIKKQAAAEGKTLPAEAESDFLKMMQQAMGPEGQAQSAAALAAGIDKIKERISKDMMQGPLSQQPSQPSDGNNNTAAEPKFSALTQSRLEALAQMRIVAENEENEYRKGTMSQKQYDKERAGIIETERQANDLIAKMKESAGKPMPPETRDQLMGMLDRAKTDILKTPEQDAAEYRAGKTGFTKEQLADIVKAREVLGTISDVQEPTLQQFSQAAQHAASRGR